LFLFKPDNLRTTRCSIFRVVLAERRSTSAAPRAGPPLMSSRQDRKVRAREARHAAAMRAQAEALKRKRLRLVYGLSAAAAVVVALSIAISSGAGATASAAGGGKLIGASLSSRLFAGVPQHGTLLGRADAPVRIVEFADLQCPYCDEYTVHALPTLVQRYVRTGEVSMRFENLSFIGPGSMTAGRVAAAAGQQDKLWNFVDLMYLNQGEENTGYITPAYIDRLLAAVPGLSVPAALGASRTQAAGGALAQANEVASEDGIDSTPSFLIGRLGGPLRLFQPSSLQATPFEQAIDSLLGRSR
jgi:protein-disulfide isomerase